MNIFGNFTCFQTQVCNYYDFSFMKAFFLNCKCNYVLDLILWLCAGFMHWSPWRIFLHSQLIIHVYMLMGTYSDAYMSEVASQLASYYICSKLKKKKKFFLSKTFPLNFKYCLWQHTCWDIRVCLSGVILSNFQFSYS